MHLGPKTLKIDVRSEKRYLDQCKDTFVKPPPPVTHDSLNQDDLSMLLGDDMMTGIFEGTSTKESKKAPEIV